MKKVSIKRIVLENYRNTASAAYELYKRTIIKGRNGSGKSTIYDAILEILTGKLADGTAPDNVRPHNTDGSDIHHVVISRGITVDIDGTESNVVKTTKEKWTQHRGQTQEVFEGNATSYQIDGYETKPKDFAVWVAQIADPETLLMCMNASPFLYRMQKSAAEARKLLEKLSGFRIEDFIAENPQYAEVAGILKGHTVEDLLKKYRKDYNLQSKEADRIRTNLEFEKSKASTEADPELTRKLAELEADKLNTETAIKALKDPREQISDIHRKIIALQGAVNEAENAHNSELFKKRDEALLNLRSAESEVARLESSIGDAERQIEQLTAHINACQRKKTAQSQLLTNAKATKYIPTHRRSVCAYSGQKCEFLVNADKETDAKEKAAFEAHKKANIELIQAEIKTCEEEIKKAEKRIKGLQKDIDGSTRALEEAKKKSAEAAETFKHLPAKVMRDKIPSCIEMLGQISTLEDKQTALSELREKERRLIDKRDALSVDIQRLKIDIAESEGVRKEHIRTVAELEQKLREAVQALADIQRWLDIVAEFSMAKNAALADMVNSHFNGIYFSFIDTNIDGSTYETLKLMSNGTEYSAMSGSEKKLAEFELCRGLQNMNDICLPLFLDEASVIDPVRLPKDCEQQVIIIQRSDDPKVIVEEG